MVGGADDAACRVEDDRDEIDPPDAGVVIGVGGEKMVAEGEEAGGFARVDRFLGGAEAFAAPGADFDEDELFAIERDEVDFARRTAPAARDDAMTAPFEQPRRVPFAEVTEALAGGAAVGHGAGSGSGRGSCQEATGANEWRWAAQGPCARSAAPCAAVP